MTEDLLREFDDHHARCIATDGEYTDAQMADVLSKTLKANYEWDRTFLRTALEKTREATVEEVENEIEATRKLMLKRAREIDYADRTDYDDCADQLTKLLTRLASLKKP